MFAFQPVIDPENKKILSSLTCALPRDVQFTLQSSQHITCFSALQVQW